MRHPEHRSGRRAGGARSLFGPASAATPAGVLRRGLRCHQSPGDAAQRRGGFKRNRHSDRPRGRICRGRAQLATAAAANPAAFAGAEGAARRYRGGGGAGAGAGSPGRLDRPRRPARIGCSSSPILPGPIVKRLVRCGSKPCPGHAKGLRRPSFWNPFPREIWTGNLDLEMTQTAAPRATGSAAWADTLLLSFAQAGYARAEPAILQPAEPFLDLSGEDIRKSLYLTTDASGEELCLRPDLTIPVARDYLASKGAGQPAGFSYLGPVFRYRGGRPSEFLQAGIESFGRQDRAAADAEILALALEATAAFGLTDVEIRTGDVALYTALIDALGLYPVWRRRLIKDFNRKVSLEQDIERLTLATSA